VVLHVAVRAEHIALRHLGQDSLLRPPPGRSDPREVELLLTWIAMMEVKALGSVLATPDAGLRRLEVAPPTSHLLASAPLPGHLALRILAVPLAPRRILLIARPRPHDARSFA